MKGVDNLWEYTQIPPSVFSIERIKFHNKSPALLLIEYDLKHTSSFLMKSEYGDINYITVVARRRYEEFVILSIETRYIRDMNGYIYCFFSLDDAKKSIPIIKNYIELAIL